MKFKYILLATSLFNLSLFSCSEDVIDPITPTTPEVPTKSVYLGIAPKINPVQTKAVITQFTAEDNIGVFVTTGSLGNNYTPESANIPSFFDGKFWAQKKQLEINSSAAVFAYYPYNSAVTDGTAVPVETASQTDYLYAVSTPVNQEKPTAELSMKHALSLISIVVKKNDYQKEGKVTKIEIEGVKTAGTMNISNGLVTPSGNNSSVSQITDIVINDAKLVRTGIITIPAVFDETSGVKIKVTVDGLIYAYDVPASHKWEAGYQYIYTLNMSKIYIPEPETTLDIEFWDKFGKEDNMSFGDNATSMLSIASNYTMFGKIVVKGEGRDFGVFVRNRSDKPFEGKLRMSLWQGDKLIEQYPAYEIGIDKKYFDGFRIPCFVTCAPGVYQLRPLFQEKGKTEWVWPRYSGGVEDADWTYTVQDKITTPALRSINIEGYLADESLIRTVEKDKPFKVEYTLTNRAGVALKGNIKAVWHRVFDGRFYDTWENDGISWEDEIGYTAIDLTANIKKYKGDLSCCITIARPSVTRCGASISLYYKAEGSTEWVLMRNDNDNVFEYLKDAINEQDVRDTFSKGQSTNMINVKL